MKQNKPNQTIIFHIREIGSMFKEKDCIFKAKEFFTKFFCVKFLYT